MELSCTPGTGHWGDKKDKTKLPPSKGLLSTRKDFIFLFHSIRKIGKESAWGVRQSSQGNISFQLGGEGKVEFSETNLKKKDQVRVNSSQVLEA